MEGPAQARRYRGFEIGILDENSTYLGVDRRLLMENAGAAVARVVERVAGDLSNASVVVVAGPGNNGGDAFVAARHLAGRVSKLSIILLTHPTMIRTEEASANWKVLTLMKKSVELYIAPSMEELLSLQHLFKEADIILDGIFGTGVKGEIREPYRTAINLINSAEAQVYAIDVPSGIDPDTGRYSMAVRPDITITLHGPKPFIDALGVEAGVVYVEAIGAPPEAEMIAGPGDLNHSLSRLRPPSKASVSGPVEAVEGAEDVLRLLGSKPHRAGPDKALTVRIEGVTVSDQPPGRGEERWAVFQSLSEYPPSNALILSRSLKAPVYLAGGWDSISDGIHVKSNWLEPPLDSDYTRGVAATLSAVFLFSGVEPIYALAAACYASRRPLREGGSTDRPGYLSRLKTLLLIT